MQAASLTAAFPGEKFSPAQYQVLARIAADPDVRSWQVGGYQSLLVLIDRRVVEAEALTGRLYLLTAEAIAIRLDAIARRIAAAEAEADEIAAMIEIGARILARAEDHAATARDAVTRLSRTPERVSDLCAARAALSEAMLDLGEQRAADRRRRDSQDRTAAELRDLRRERLRLRLAAARRTQGGTP